MEILESLREEKRVIRSAPFSFLVFLAIGATAGYWVSSLNYGGQVASLREQLDAKDAQVGRYRVALGIEPGSKGALVELTNEELALKAKPLVEQLRQFNAELAEKQNQIGKRASIGEIAAADVGKERLAVDQEISKEFDSTIASDVYNVENALRSRLDSSALSHVMMVPGFIVNGDPRTRITIPGITRGPMQAMMLDRLADEIEQMAKLLPPDSRKP
jgi:hypothetical protein